MLEAGHERGASSAVQPRSSGSLTKRLRSVFRLKPRTFVHTFGDLHLYANHLDQAKLQLTREPRSLPQMKLNPAVKNLRQFAYEDFELMGYAPHPTIKAPIAV